MNSEDSELRSKPAGPAPSPGLRIGSVDSLNAVPLTRGIEERVLFTAPSRLGRLLRDGALEVALLSVTELLTRPDYTALDSIAIASRGPVRSVLLAHQVPLEQLTGVACDPASLTSVNLLRVLLAERGLRPRFRTLSAAEEDSKQAGVLLIGDRALDFALRNPPHQVWDLGAAWTALTGLPFVYAVWTFARGADATALGALLRHARDRGRRELDAVVREDPRYTPEFRREYLTHNIRFDLGREEKRGLQRFAELLRRHTDLQIHPPRFVAAG